MGGSKVTSQILHVFSVHSIKTVYEWKADVEIYQLTEFQGYLKKASARKLQLLFAQQKLALVR